MIPRTLLRFVASVAPMPGVAAVAMLAGALAVPAAAQEKPSRKPLPAARPAVVEENQAVVSQGDPWLGGKLPAPVLDLVLARRFVLDEPTTYPWTQERPKILFGTLLVLKVDRDLARPRQVDMPVLYVGATPAEVANGHPLSDHRIAFVPGEVDLTRAPVFFGSTRLPETVDRARGLEELRRARAAGIRPFSEKAVSEAWQRGGAPLHVRDAKDLYVAIADLIDLYAPAERDVARGMRAPRVGER